MSPDSIGAVRQSVIAGDWYPASSVGLRRMIEEYLAQVPQFDLPGRVLALVSPHAGYRFSGATAAFAFAQVRGAAFERVVLLGPLHRPIWGSRIGSFMVPGEEAFHTPLGEVPIDRDFIDQLGQRVDLTPVRGDKEHSLEIEIPFLQVTLGEFALAPIMLGEHISDRGASARIRTLVDALVEFSDERTLMVASTDLSHLNNYADVVRIDRELAALIDALDVDGVTRALQAGQMHACGATGLVTVLRAAQKLGAHTARVLSYTTSGDVSGDKRPGAYTVGYLAAAVYG